MLMSKRSLNNSSRASSKALLPAVAIGLLLAGPASAQTKPDRTPTNPLDGPGIHPEPRSPAPPPAPDAPPPRAPTPSPSVDPPRLAPMAVAGEALPLDELLPASIRSTGGMSEAEAIARAEKHAPASAQAALSRDAADAGVTVAELGFLPSLQVGARYTRLSPITPGTFSTFNTPGCLQDLSACQNDPEAFQVDAVLQQPILNQFSLTASVGYNLTDLVFRKRHVLRQAEADADVARAQADASELDVRQTAIQTYWSVARARVERDIVTEARSVAARRVSEARERLAQGLTTNLEVLQAEGLERSRAQLERIAASRLKLAETQLRHLLGYAKDQPLPALRTSGSLRAPETAPETDALVRDAMTSSPDLAAARARVAAAEARGAQNDAAFIPSLSASFNVNYDNPNQRIFPQTETFTGTWDATVALQWSVDGAIIAGARKTQLDLAATRERLARDQAKQQIEERVIVAAGNVDAAQLGVESARYNATAAQRRFEQTRARREQGMATMTELASAENEWLSARLSLVDALVDARLTDAELRRVVGDPSKNER